MSYFLGFILIGGILMGVASIFSDITKYIVGEIRSIVKRYQQLDKSHEIIMNKYSAYYISLPSSRQAEFRERVQRFMYSKRFIPRGIKEVTAEMKVLISASAIQLTFGLDAIYLTNFDKILIYPSAYYSNISKKYHLGEVNPRAGIIIISWESFVDGYADLTDSKNLGIHEMAHAIHFENMIRNDEHNFLPVNEVRRLEDITDREIKKIKSGATHFLREYAATNEYEFFAVALEYFFEQPREMKNAMPNLFKLLVRLLNQDPIKMYNLQS